MGDWKIIVPRETYNLFTDPSFYLADPDTEWTISGDGTPDFTKTYAYSVFGSSAALADLGGGSYATIKQLITINYPMIDHTLSAYIRRAGGGVPTSAHVRAEFYGSTRDWDSITPVNEKGWYYCVLTYTVAPGGDDFGVVCKEDGMYVDGMQLEAIDQETTFCDGNQEGCEWLGAPYTSISHRSPLIRGGGVIFDLKDDYGFRVARAVGIGAAPVKVSSTEYGQLPGGVIDKVIRAMRPFTLMGRIVPTSTKDLGTCRRELRQALASDAVPEHKDGPQPIRIRYTGGASIKEISATYVGGLEGTLDETALSIQVAEAEVPVQFLAKDPTWYGIGDGVSVIDSQDTTTFWYCAGRLRTAPHVSQVAGQWNNLGLTTYPTTGGTIYSVCRASDGTIYFGGNYTGLCNNGAPAYVDSGCDYIARFDPQDGTWSTLVGPSDLNGAVWCIKEGPNQDIYLCGDFTDVNSEGYDYIVVYHPTTNTWSGLGDPDSGLAAIVSAREMAFDSSGNLYVVGNFENWNDVAAADYIAKWNGTAWSAVGAPNPDSGYPKHIAIDSLDNIVIGGAFHDFLGDGSDYDYLVRWNGSSWSDLGSGTQAGDILSLVFSSSDILYLAGTFVNQGGNADCDYVCSWNGEQFIPMVGWDTLSTISGLGIAPDGRIFACGWTIGAGGLASWNGSCWEIWDIDYDPLCIAFGTPDPIVPTNYDIWVGSDSEAVSAIAGITNVTNEGDAPEHPIFTVSRTGGTYATVFTLKNELTGKSLRFDYPLLDGEELVVDCRPEKQTIVSSFFGPKPSALLPYSDLGTFKLYTGVNPITCFVRVVGSPTIVASLTWRQSYDGFE